MSVLSGDVYTPRHTQGPGLVQKALAEAPLCAELWARPQWLQEERRPGFSHHVLTISLMLTRGMKILTVTFREPIGIYKMISQQQNPVKIKRAVLPILQMGNSTQKGQTTGSWPPSHAEPTSPLPASSEVTFHWLTFLSDILNFSRWTILSMDMVIKNF